MATRPVRIGILGTRVQPTLEITRALQSISRLHAGAVYCPSIEEGARLSVECGISPCWSLHGLCAAVDGIVAVDVGWMGSNALLFCLERQRPLLVLPQIVQVLVPEDLERLKEVAAKTVSLFLPGLLRRWDPVTLRLRELTATQLGAIESIDYFSACAAADDTLIEDLDWCCNVVQSTVRSVMYDPDSGRLELRFRRKTTAGDPVRAVIFLSRSGTGSPPSGQTTVYCRHGRIRLLGSDRLEWITDRRPCEEHLSQERQPMAVALDLFGRRIVGGLVPVPSVDDLIAARMILAGLRRSGISGTEIPID